MSNVPPELASGYYLEREPEALVLRRDDGSLAAAFSNRGAALEAIRWAAEEAGYGGAFASTPDTSRLTSSRSLGLEARFFGRFELRKNGAVVSLSRNGKALAILKYLLAHHARPTPQDHLMGWLWPESDLKRARWSLNTAIYALRRFLSGSLPSLPTSETVLFKGGEYWLSPCIALSTDVDEFDAHYAEGCRLEKAGRVSEAISQYQRAAHLYRDDYLIEDLYEEWTAIERERLIESYTYLSRRMAIYYIETGQDREGIRTCYRILEKDRCDEGAHRLLMQCFVRLGQRPRALRQYRLCEGALKQKYGMPPCPETQSLHQNILQDGNHWQSIPSMKPG